MSYLPVVAGAGIVGWSFLQRTYDAQFAAFSGSSSVERDSDYFQSRIGEVASARELVADRRLLNVALGAFGLQDDIDNRYFIQRILQDGTADEGALANKLADDRYRKLSEAFGFGPGETPTTGEAGKMADLLARYRVQAFEVAVGEVDDTMRIAMFARRGLEELAREDSSDAAKWYRVLGQPPLRAFLETAFGLPQSFGGADIEKQVDTFRARAVSVTGSDSLAVALDPEGLDRLTNLYLARSQIAAFDAATSSGANALLLLQSSG